MNAILASHAAAFSQSLFFSIIFGQPYSMCLHRNEEMPGLEVFDRGDFAVTAQVPSKHQIRLLCVQRTYPACIFIAAGISRTRHLPSYKPLWIWSGAHSLPERPWHRPGAFYIELA